MSAAAYVKPSAGASPRFKARLAGGLYFFSLVTAASVETFVHGRLNIVGGLVAVAGMAAMTMPASRVQVLWLAIHAVETRPPGKAPGLAPPQIPFRPFKSIQY